ncbi:NUDIX domain-containing protein [Brassicibacter mesophilus]|uniref:NUDIX hydrolase n=1 Tax=Brassicibacter mesophilus TaxID=745119 RepID=UPI003D1A8813
MKVELLEIGQVKEDDLRFAVISALFKDKWIFVKHKERDTLEIPGGHREIGEDINATAKRELFEETGAKTFKIEPICDYSVTRDDESSYGRLFYAEIKDLGDLPDLEIGKVELFNKLPEKLTYPDIQPFLHNRALREKIKREYFGKKVKVVMDRPLGSKHKKHGFIYPINYGYLPNTISGDGEEIDAYILGEFEPLKSYEGYVAAIIHRKNDNEDKLVVCRELDVYNKDQIKALTEFQERFFESEIIMY